MAWAIRSVFWFSIGLDLLFNAFSRYLHPPTDPFAIKGLTNVMSGVMGAVSVYGAYNIYKRRNLPEPPNPDAAPPRTMMWIWLLGASFLVFVMFWPLVWQVSLNLRLLRRIALLAYLLFEAREEYRENRRKSAVCTQGLIPEETARGALSLKIMAGIVIAIGLGVVSVGFWYAKTEWSKVTEWPRTAAVLVDKEFSPVGARLIFEYDVTGGRSAGRVDRWGRKRRCEPFLSPTAWEIATQLATTHKTPLKWNFTSVITGISSEARSQLCFSVRYSPPQA